MSRTTFLILIALPMPAICLAMFAATQLVENASNDPPATSIVEAAVPSAEHLSAGAEHASSGGDISQRTLVENPVNHMMGLPSAQPQQGGQRRRGYDTLDASNRRGIPSWNFDTKFEHDVFRFVRVKYNSWGGRQYHRLGRWATDFPDSDLNFSYRLQQLTSIKVNPDPLSLAITDERLFDYPFLYMIEPGTLYFTDAEIVALRRYLLNGGFLMVDDFWGTAEWQNFEREIKKVFPDREIKELDLSHKIFHYVYDLKEKPQIPSIRHWEYYGDTSERGYDSDEVHYKAIEDDNDRIMVMICHNTDLGDGWEREGESREYFELFSEKHAYPLGINIVLYAMTQ